MSLNSTIPSTNSNTLQMPDRRGIYTPTLSNSHWKTGLQKQWALEVPVVTLERILVPFPTLTSCCQPLEVFSPVVLVVCDVHVQLCLRPGPHSIYLVPSLESSGAHWKTPVHLFGVHWVLSHLFVQVSLPWYLKLLACLLGSLFLHFDIHLRC